MRVLVTGGAGFLGSHLCDFLLGHGCEVVCMDNLLTGSLDNIAHIQDPRAELTDFAETAALIANLDLVVTVDTAVAHLAGALAAPTFVLLPFAPDWRWLRSRGDSPWYPTMRLFCQTEWGRWGPVFARVAEALRARVAGASSG